ncbi:MAG: hypothetical protein JXR70_16555 [Spirochaetales bacterium]|nr:hypothetical protein [Spirochaetales bacterium]
MSINYYVAKNTLGKGKPFFARTLINERVDEKELINLMLDKGTSLTATDLAAVLGLLKETVVKVLRAGKSIAIDDFISLSPSVNASFEMEEEPFNHFSHNIKVNCHASRKLVKAVSYKAVVEKTVGNKKGPVLTSVISGSDNENLIRFPHSTTVKGKNLAPYNYELNQVHISERENSVNSLVIHSEDLVIDSLGDRKVVFSMKPGLEIPEWLTQGLPVFMRLLYHNGNENLDLYSLPVETYWLEVPEEMNVADDQIMQPAV